MNGRFHLDLLPEWILLRRGRSNAETQIDAELSPTILEKFIVVNGWRPRTD
jgi:hypothetical protein